MTTSLKLSQRFLFVATFVATTFVATAQVSDAKSPEHKNNMGQLYYGLGVFVVLIVIVFFNARGKGKENTKRTWLQFMRGRFRGY